MKKTPRSGCHRNPCICCNTKCPSNCFVRCLATLCHGCRLAAPFLMLYTATFVVIMPIVCGNLRNSLFYNKTATISQKEEEVRLMEVNKARLESARREMSTWNAKETKSFLASWDRNKTNIELVIVSQSRNRIGMKLQNYEPFYLTQVAHKWITLLSESGFRHSKYSVHLSICDVDEHPETYAEARELSNFVPTETRFLNKSSNFQLASSGVIARKTKEKEDFVFCQNAALDRGPDYVLVVEDDAFPADDFFVVLRHILDTRLEEKFVRGEISVKENISWIKLYHPEPFTLFVAYEQERVPEWLALSVVLGSILTFINVKLELFTGNVYILWIIFTAYAVLLTVIISRPNLMYLRRFFTPYLYGYYPAPGCCTPAMLYTADGARGFTDYLNSTLDKHKRYARDQVQDLYVQNSSVKIHRYMVQPNLVSHIGVVSSVRVSVDVTRVESKKKL